MPVASVNASARAKAGAIPRGGDRDKGCGKGSNRVRNKHRGRHRAMGDARSDPPWGEYQAPCVYLASQWPKNNAARKEGIFLGWAGS